MQVTEESKDGMHTGRVPPEGILNTSQVVVGFHDEIIAKLFQGT